jgi:hypothetical protein
MKRTSILIIKEEGCISVPRNARIVFRKILKNIRNIVMIKVLVIEKEAGFF